MDPAARTTAVVRAAFPFFEPFRAPFDAAACGRGVSASFRIWSIDSIITNFFWLTIPEPEKGQSIDVAVRDNTARITTRNVKEFDLDLDGRKYLRGPSFLTLLQSYRAGS